MQWDIIEYSLQSREFWLFLNNIGQERATRIELIFFLIAKNDMLHCGYEEGVTEKDDYFTFRYFYRFMSKEIEYKLSKNKIIKKIWDCVMEIYQTLKEWYDDMELYHYIGFWYAAIIQISYTLFIMNGINQNSSLSLKMFS